MTKLQRTVLGAAVTCALLGGALSAFALSATARPRRPPPLAQYSDASYRETSPEPSAKAGSSQSEVGAKAEQAATPAGDAARGKALIESSACFDCHRIGDRGSRLGPDLSDIGNRRTPDRLRRALVAPDEEVLSENRFVRVVMKDGTTITGRLLNQDAISVQLINPKEELKSYLRASLREYTILDKGLMPSTEGKLTDQQVADIVSYLSSLKGT
jgi:putative heme-binding domain-containing protein